jgi:hypothetical protein
MAEHLQCITIKRISFNDFLHRKIATKSEKGRDVNNVIRIFCGIGIKTFSWYTYCLIVLLLVSIIISRLLYSFRNKRCQVENKKKKFSPEKKECNEESKRTECSPKRIYIEEKRARRQNVAQGEYIYKEESKKTKCSPGRINILDKRARTHNVAQGE